MTSPDNPPLPVAAACLVLIRDGARRADGRSLEVLITERNGGMTVAGGAFVFPGGKVAAEDEGIAADGVEHLTFRHCAVRETFEETGVVLARRDRAWVDRAEQEDILGRYNADKSGQTFAALLRARACAPACDALLPFSHWITPAIRPQRFDTRFYLAVMPEAQVVRHDGEEAVQALWVAPDEMIARYGHDISKLMFPTRMSLSVLAGAGTVDEATALVRERPVVPITPQLEKRADGIYAHVPEAAGFGGTVFPFQLKR